MAGKVLEIYWQQITQQQLPFPTSRAITTLPSGNGAIANSGISDYLGPEFEGIYLRTNGLSGAAERWYIECTLERSYEKFKIYVNFGSNWYVYEIQVWGPGTWSIENPSGQPRIPNQLILGAVVAVFDDFPPNEANPLFPPPTENPFIPNLQIEGKEDISGNFLERAWATLSTPSDVSIDSVFVYCNENLLPVSLSDLLSRQLFTEIGDYEIIINYHYKTWPQEILNCQFTIVSKEKIAPIKLSARKTATGATLECKQFDFGLYDKEGTLFSKTKNQ